MDERKDKRPGQGQDGALFVDEAPFEDLGLDESEAAPRGDRDEREGRPGDGKAEESQDILEDLIDHMDLDADVEIREDGERIVLDIEGPDAGRAIGKKGQTLDALQFLLNKIVNRFPGGRRHIVVDSGDYRERHEKGLEQLARREAKRAMTEGKVITLEPMTARDRRVIHLSLAKFEGVATQSQGEGMHRRIQILPARGAGGGEIRQPRSGDRPSGGGEGGAPRRRRRRRGGGGGAGERDAGGQPQGGNGDGNGGENAAQADGGDSGDSGVDNAD